MLEYQQRQQNGGGSDDFDKSCSNANGSAQGQNMAEQGKNPDPLGVRMFPSQPAGKEQLSSYLHKNNTAIPEKIDFAKLKAQPRYEKYNGEDHLVIDNGMNNRSLEQEVDDALGRLSYDNSIENEAVP